MPASPGGSVRAWVAACSSGEEAYSLAMLLVEEAERAGKELDIKVFATDLAERALAHARAGVYPGGIESDLTPERLERFFTPDDSVYRVRADLRECVVFAPQNVLQDPPFSRLDIVTCRNLLIYLEPQVQQRLLALVHFGLVEGGALFLGSSETVAGSEDLFAALDKKARIFRRVGPTRHGLGEFPLPHGFAARGEDEGRPGPGWAGGPRPSIKQLTQHTLLMGHTPPAVTVDREHRIHYFHGDTRAFLQQPPGEPTRDLMLLAREGVRGAVRVALHRAAAHGERVTVLDGWAEVEPGRRTRIAVVVSPVAPDPAPGEKPGPPEYFVIGFEERGDFAPPASRDEAEKGTESADELRRLRAELQRTVEELQTSNEELRASNEEVMSINEEFQAANEELETSREEMQSLNEELTTVNAQLRAKVEEHLATSSDLSSLLSSTDIAVLFLDTAFRIRRYTPAVRALLDLIASDVGRPLAALARRFDDPQLDDDARAVLERLVPVEREVVAADGRYYLRRVLPYRTADNRIDGVVVTFVDISAWKKAEEALRASEEQFRRAVEEAPIPIIMYAENGQVLQISRTWTELTGYALADMQTFDAWLTRAYGPGADAVRVHMRDLFGDDRRTLGLDLTIRTRGGAERQWSFSASAPGSLRDGRRFVVGMAVDVTELRRAHERAVQAERLAAIGQAITTLAHEGRNALQRAHACLSRLGMRLEGKPEAVDLAGRTQQALEDLQRLFDDIRSYASPIVLDVRACDLGDLWREAWSLVLVRYPGRDAGLEEDLDETTLACDADQFRLGLVFANLFANALDACPDPVRVVVVCRGALLGDRPALRVTVRDNGPGFNPEQRRHAFEPFRTTKAKGTGLGLAIVKRIVDAHGGTIAIDDSPDGAAITLTLPLQQIGTTPPRHLEIRIYGGMVQAKAAPPNGNKLSRTGTPTLASTSSSDNTA